MQTLRTNLADHAVVAAIKAGAIASAVVDFDFCGPSVANAGFKPMVRDAAFDAGELAIATYLQARAYGKPISLLPITVMARLQHGFIEYNTAAGTLRPQQIEGRRVGVRAYTQTTGIWVRGLLQDEYGVDLSRVTWACTDEPHLAEYRDPPNVERIARRSDEIGPMLLAGELDVAIVNGELSAKPGVEKLIPEQEGQAWFARTGIVPINHMFVLRSDLAADPDLVGEIWRMFTQSKARMTAPDGPDMLPMGIEACRRPLEVMIRYCLEQKIIDRPVSVEELFDGPARNLI